LILFFLLNKKILFCSRFIHDSRLKFNAASFLRNYFENIVLNCSISVTAITAANCENFKQCFKNRAEWAVQLVEWWTITTCGLVIVVSSQFKQFETVESCHVGFAGSMFCSVLKTLILGKYVQAHVYCNCGHVSNIFCDFFCFI